MVTKVEFPDFEKIVLECKDLITVHFEKYTNSWQKITSKTWWVKRLYDKTRQIESALEEKDEIDKLEDLINITSMRLDHLLKRRPVNEIEDDEPKQA